MVHSLVGESNSLSEFDCELATAFSQSGAVSGIELETTYFADGDGDAKTLSALETRGSESKSRSWASTRIGIGGLETQMSLKISAVGDLPDDHGFSNIFRAASKQVTRSKMTSPMLNGREDITSSILPTDADEIYVRQSPFPAQAIAPATLDDDRGHNLPASNATENTPGHELMAASAVRYVADSGILKPVANDSCAQGKPMVVAAAADDDDDDVYDYEDDFVVDDDDDDEDSSSDTKMVEVSSAETATKTRGADPEYTSKVKPHESSPLRGGVKGREPGNEANDNYSSTVPQKEHPQMPPANRGSFDTQLCSLKSNHKPKFFPASEKGDSNVSKFSDRERLQTASQTQRVVRSKTQLHIGGFRKAPGNRIKRTASDIEFEDILAELTKGRDQVSTRKVVKTDLQTPGGDDPWTAANRHVFQRAVDSEKKFWELAEQNSFRAKKRGGSDTLDKSKCENAKMKRSKCLQSQEAQEELTDRLGRYTISSFVKTTTFSKMHPEYHGVKTPTTEFWRKMGRYSNHLQGQLYTARGHLKPQPRPSPVAVSQGQSSVKAALNPSASNVSYAMPNRRSVTQTPGAAKSNKTP